MSSIEEDSTMGTGEMDNQEQVERRTPSGRRTTSRRRREAASTAARVEHFTVAERTARGKAARAEVPRASHGRWEPALPSARSRRAARGAGADPGARARSNPVRPDARLAVHVYRGAAYLMASDLASGPRTGLHTQLCGDAHLSNFGGFAAPDRRMVFSVNDFDETLPGPSSGTSSGSSRALRSRDVIAASRSSGRRSTGKWPGHTARASGGSPG